MTRRSIFNAFVSHCILTITNGHFFHCFTMKINRRTACNQNIDVKIQCKVSLQIAIIVIYAYFLCHYIIISNPNL